MTDTQSSANTHSIHRVLIVEDERPLAAAIADTLDSAGGLQTIVAHSGEQALQLVRAVRPDLILMDVSLPGQSGLDICKLLKHNASTAPIPVIFITARAEPADRERGLAAGAQGYLTKPFSPTHLIEMVNHILEGATEFPLPAPVAGAPADQLQVYAQELRRLFEQERRERLALQAARSRLDDLDRLKADFVSTITHELRTPFSIIGMALQVIQQTRDQLPPPQQEALDDVVNELAGLYRLINGVVKFAELVNKRRALQRGYYTPDKLIPLAVQPLTTLAQSREIDLRVLVASDIPAFYVDPELINEAVFQMVHNALKFNHPGGEVQVQVGASEHWITIEVRDNGVGLTPERLALLGKPFEQEVDALRRGREGLGIGWTFACYVAEAHGGWTHVESPGPGQGSVFTLALPLAFADASEESPPSENNR